MQSLYLAPVAAEALTNEAGPALYRLTRTTSKGLFQTVKVLTPKNCQLIFIDQQPQMAFGVQSIDRQVLKNNVVALAKAAKVFKIPTTITSVETQSFSGYTILVARRIPGPEAARAHVHEFLGRYEGARRPQEKRPEQGGRFRPLDRGLQ